MYDMFQSVVYVEIYWNVDREPLGPARKAHGGGISCLISLTYAKSRYDSYFKYQKNVW